MDIVVQPDDEPEDEEDAEEDRREEGVPALLRRRAEDRERALPRERAVGMPCRAMNAFA